MPPLVLYLLSKRWNTLGTPSSSSTGANAVAIFCATLLGPIWWLRAATPDWSVISYSLVLAVIGLTISLLAARIGWAAAWKFGCPTLLMLLAVPWPQRMETMVIQSLTRSVALCATETLQWFGIAAEHRGNLVSLTSGTLGISEACSGLRSVQSMVLAACALGELHRLKATARLLLLLAGIAIALAFNLIRNVTLSSIAAHSGIARMEQYHDATGTLILVLSFVALFILASRMGGFAREIPSEGKPLDWPLLPSSGAVLASLWLLGVLVFVEGWYRSNEAFGASFHPFTVHWPIHQADFAMTPVADRTRDLLLCSEARNASWKEEDATVWGVTAIEWSPGATSPQLARVHRPEVCLQATGMELLRKESPLTFRVAGEELKFEPLAFKAGENTVYVFFTLYENGNHDADGDLEETARSRVRRALCRQRNTGQQMIELRVAGCRNYAQATAAVSMRIASLLDRP